MEQDDDEKVVLDKLETLQHAHNELEVRYLKELRELQKKYQTIFSYNYNQRCQLLHDPKYKIRDILKELNLMDDEISPRVDDGKDGKGKDGGKDTSSLAIQHSSQPHHSQLSSPWHPTRWHWSLESGSRGPVIANFWLQTMKNHPMLRDMVTAVDEPVLFYLKDINCTESNDEFSQGFQLRFVFSDNPFFTPNTLVKTYRLESSELWTHQFSQRPNANGVLTSIESTDIMWRHGRNVTKKLVTRKQINKRTRQIRKITKTTDLKSFFTFFQTYSTGLVGASRLHTSMTGVGPTGAPSGAAGGALVSSSSAGGRGGRGGSSVAVGNNASDAGGEHGTSNDAVMIESDYWVACLIRDQLIPHALEWYMDFGERFDDLSDVDFSDQDDISVSSDDEQQEQLNAESCQQQ